MATFVMFDEALSNIGKGLIDLDTNSFKVALTNTAPTQDTNTQLSDITQIANGNGYTTGGVAVTVTWVETGAGTGIWRFDTSDPSWTASGGDIPAHRYAVWYDDTSAADLLLGYVDMGSSSVIANGNTRTWNVPSGVFEITVP